MESGYGRRLKLMKAKNSKMSSFIHHPPFLPCSQEILSHLLSSEKEYRGEYRSESSSIEQNKMWLGGIQLRWENWVACPSLLPPCTIISHTEEPSAGRSQALEVTPHLRGARFVEPTTPNSICRPVVQMVCSWCLRNDCHLTPRETWEHAVQDPPQEHFQRKAGTQGPS